MVGFKDRFGLLTLELEGFTMFYLHFGNYLFGILSLAYFESAKVGSKRQNQDIDGRRAATEPVFSATGP